MTKKKDKDEPVVNAVVDAIATSDPHRRPDGEHGLLGHFVEILKGDYKGTKASFEKILETDKHGVPTQVYVRTRDADSVYLSLPYKDVKHTDFKGGR